MSLSFFREFLRAPGTVGALWPSSPALARMMVRAAGVAEADFVVEIGPGTGAFTGEILASMRPDATFFALEKRADLAGIVSERFPQARVATGCATELTLYLKDGKKPGVVVSGLPWAAFPEPLQDGILAQITESLQPGGTFATFAYFGPHWLAAGRAFRRKLHRHFASVHRSSLVLANLPPAFIYLCRQ